jgi:DNA-binding NarL/FixJ family response regulator
VTNPRIIVADDHAIFAEGLKRLLEPEYEIVAIVHDGNGLVTAARELKPDVILADISMPGLNGIEAARQLKDSGVNAKIILLTMHQDVTYATTALDEGVDGYILKHDEPRELLAAIRDVLKGNLYVSPTMAGEVFSYRSRSGAARRSQVKLTSRQQEVLRQLAAGKIAKEIAANLGLSQKTVEYHKYRMMQELDIRTGAELIQYAIRHGFVSD